MIRITLSFDDGPDPVATNHVLDVLARHDVKSSFFVIGRKLENSEARRAAERAVAEGHWLGGHSYAHETPMGWMDDPEAAIPEIDLCAAAIGDLGCPEPMYRPFGAGGITDTRLLNARAVEHLMARGFTCVLWDLSPKEWKNRDSWVDMVMTEAAQQPWTVLAVRDTENDAMRHLDGLLHRLREEGVEIVQEFPPHSMPIRRGALVGSLDGYVGTGRA